MSVEVTAASYQQPAKKFARKTHLNRWIVVSSFRLYRTTEIWALILHISRMYDTVGGNVDPIRSSTSKKTPRTKSSSPRTKSPTKKKRKRSASASRSRSNSKSQSRSRSRSRSASKGRSKSRSRSNSAGRSGTLWVTVLLMNVVCFYSYVFCLHICLGGGSNMWSLFSAINSSIWQVRNKESRKSGSLTFEIEVAESHAFAMSIGIKAASSTRYGTPGSLSIVLLMLFMCPEWHYFVLWYFSSQSRPKPKSKLRLRPARSSSLGT